MERVHTIQNRGMDALFYDFLYGGWDKNVFRAASCGIGLLTQSKQKTGKDLSCCSSKTKVVVG